MAEIGGASSAAGWPSCGPDLPVLYMSGYPEDEVVRRGLLEEHRLFIQKPFTPSVLVETVRRLLDATAPARAQE